MTECSPQEGGDGVGRGQRNIWGEGDAPYLGSNGLVLGYTDVNTCQHSENVHLGIVHFILVLPLYHKNINEY